MNLKLQDKERPTHMSDERKRGYPPRYTLLKGLVLPADLEYVNQVQAEQNLRTRDHALRLILKEAREAKRLLKSRKEPS